MPLGAHNIRQLAKPIGWAEAEAPTAAPGHVLVALCVNSRGTFAKNITEDPREYDFMMSAYRDGEIKQPALYELPITEVPKCPDRGWAPIDFEDIKGDMGS